MKTRIVMLLMVCRVIFPAVSATAGRDARPEIEIRRVVSITVSKHIKNLTQTAKVEIASRWMFAEKGVQIKQLLHRNDPIEIHTGYGNQYVKRFDGFIRTVSPTIPVLIECDDWMFKLKNTPVKDAGYKNVKISTLLDTIIPASYGITYDILDTEIGTFTHRDANVAMILDKIKEVTGMVVYFKGKTLFIGKAYIGRVGAEARKPVCQLHIQRNVKKNDLTYQDPDDLKVNMVVIIKQKGKDKRLEYGPDVDGKIILEKVTGVTEEQAKGIAEAKTALFKKAGLKGKIGMYLLPYIEVGDVVQIVDSQYPEKNGNYFVDGTEETYNASTGGTQLLTLGSKAN